MYRKAVETSRPSSMVRLCVTFVVGEGFDVDVNATVAIVITVAVTVAVLQSPRLIDDKFDIVSTIGLIDLLFFLHDIAPRPTYTTSQHIPYDRGRFDSIPIPLAMIPTRNLSTSGSFGKNDKIRKVL